MKKIIKFIVDLCYPPVCLLCGEIIYILNEEKYICKSCMEKEKFIELGCIKCGRETNNNENICYMCKKNKEINFLEKNYPLFYYDEYKKYVYKFKFGKEKIYGELIGEYLKKYITERNLDGSIDYVIAVPMHKKKEKKRGFNQSILLGKKVSKYIDKPFIKKCLIRNRQTRNQSELTIEERKKNLIGSFEFKCKINVKNKNILIVDDIYTSGSTIIECAKILKSEGVNKVYSLTFTISKNKKN